MMETSRAPNSAVLRTADIGGAPTISVRPINWTIFVMILTAFVMILTARLSIDHKPFLHRR
jgi:hypothetical protein